MILWKFGFAILMLSVTSFANQTIAIEVHHTNLHGDSPATALKDFAAQAETKNPAEQKAAERLRSMAEQGNIKAQFNLGVRYAQGRGVPRNIDEAIRWYQLAAKQGLAEAQFNLGLLYDSGHGVTKNTQEAVKWYRKAAKQGNVPAQTNLGAIYEVGQDVPRNTQAALHWYQRAAKRGGNQAQLSLGLMYCLGRGVPQDVAIGYVWIALAAEQGNSQAQILQNRLQKLITSARRERVNKLLPVYLASYVEPYQ